MVADCVTQHITLLAIWQSPPDVALRVLGGGGTTPGGGGGDNVEVWNQGERENV